MNDPQAWVVPWARWSWAILFLAMIVLELVTVWWNDRYGDGRRANLTAYVQAYFGIGNRRLKRRGRPVALLLVFALGLLHFMGYF